LSLLGLSFPEFYLGILLIFFFSVKLQIFPAMSGGNLDNLASRLHHLALPACTLGMIMISFVSRMTRSSLLNVLQEDYVRTARAKGLNEFFVIFKHALRNALIPVTTVVGLYFSILIAGSVLTEMVFTRPGLGKMMVFAVKDRDYMLLQSTLIIFTGFVFVINTVTDILYVLIDPRIRR
jgi:ABC-type dipeptide/oligopeptide/nickel transport system permease component